MACSGVPMSEIVERLVSPDGKTTKVQPGVRLMPGQKVGIDECTTVFPICAFGLECVLSPEEVEYAVAKNDTRLFDTLCQVLEADLIRPLGLSLGEKVFPFGVNCYKFGREIGTGAGLIAVGGNASTVMLRITGHGSLVAKTDWTHVLNSLLHRFQGHLTRIDLAFDDFCGQIYKVRDLASRIDEGIFQRSNTSPKFRQEGDWLRDDPRSTGLTLYVGDRHSKMARIYEKGKELGDPDSPWVRFEVELHSSLYELIPDMLLHPTKYFAALYPACEWIEFGGDMQRLELKSRTGVQDLEAIGKWIRTQTGHYLHQLRQHVQDKDLLDWLCRKAKPVAALQALENLSPTEVTDLIRGFSGLKEENK